ncbi:MAG TPA: type II toxin-antitoxin system PemK/MazF family toxin [bacterium]|nr:type II toxin-antitoxin system PemK/MazF family toxin [bacterium]
MPSTTNYDFGDVLLVPFPFSNQAAVKKRPAVVVSSSAYNQTRPDLIILALTSQPPGPSVFGGTSLSHWKGAGLLKPSVFKPILATIEKGLVIQKMGRLHASDQKTLQQILKTIITFN